MDLNTVPWTHTEIVDFCFLVAATVMVTAFPVGYGLRARLKDPLAISVVAATSLTAMAFITSVVLTLYLHTGHMLSPTVSSWVGRILVIGVGVGKIQLLWMLLRTPRNAED